MIQPRERARRSANRSTFSASGTGTCAVSTRVSAFGISILLRPARGRSFVEVSVAMFDYILIILISIESVKLGMHTRPTPGSSTATGQNPPRRRGGTGRLNHSRWSHSSAHNHLHNPRAVYLICYARNVITLAALVMTYAAQVSINSLRFSNSSVLSLSACTLFLMVCANALTQTTQKKKKHTTTQTQKVERKP